MEIESYAKIPGIYSPSRYTNFMQNNMIAYGVGYETIIFIILKKTGIFCNPRIFARESGVQWACQFRWQQVRYITERFICKYYYFNMFSTLRKNSILSMVKKEMLAS